MTTGVPRSSTPPFGGNGWPTLLAWRRDVRRFSDRPVPDALVDELLDLVQLSPSVGNSQPWRWVRVDSLEARIAIRANFRDCNACAQAAQPDAHADAYAALKLEGMDRAPLQLAVFCDKETAQGHGLGQRTMPETAEYSTVSMITTFWLAARAAGLGVGWVSILDPARVGEISTCRRPGSSSPISALAGRRSSISTPNSNVSAGRRVPTPGGGSRLSDETAPALSLRSIPHYYRRGFIGVGHWVQGV